MMLKLACLLAVISADPDKSLAPDGKAWSATSVCEYLAEQLKPPSGFKLTKQLEMEFGVGAKKKSFVVSETKARQKLLDKIVRKHKLEGEPKRGILVFGFRDSLIAQIKSEQRSAAFFATSPLPLAADKQAQDVYWLWAAELLDWSGDQDAAEDYLDGFSKVPGNEILEAFRWHSITFTGSPAAVIAIKRTLEKYAGYLPEPTADSN